MDIKTKINKLDILRMSILDGTTASDVSPSFLDAVMDDLEVLQKINEIRQEFESDSYSWDDNTKVAKFYQIMNLFR